MRPYRKSWVMSSFRTLAAMVAFVLSLAALGPSTSLSIASNSEEISGQGTITRERTLLSRDELSNCGDLDTSTFMRSVVRSGTDTFSGIIAGTSSSVDNRFINNTCVPALRHGAFRTIVSFNDVTVADRRGGAILEFIGHFQDRAAEVDGFPVSITTEAGEFRFLCGTGALKGIRGTGIYNATVIPSTPVTTVRDLRGYAIWIHFDEIGRASCRERV